MTAQEIDDLIAKRNRIAVRYAYRTHQLDQIDRKLRQVPPGADNRVDLALGRPCAVLPDRPVILQSINYSEEHQYLVCSCGYEATGMIDGIQHIGNRGDTSRDFIASLRHIRIALSVE